MILERVVLSFAVLQLNTREALLSCKNLPHPVGVENSPLNLVFRWFLGTIKKARVQLNLWYWCCFCLQSILPMGVLIFKRLVLKLSFRLSKIILISKWLDKTPLPVQGGSYFSSRTEIFSRSLDKRNKLHFSLA